MLPGQKTYSSRPGLLVRSVDDGDYNDGAGGEVDAAVCQRPGGVVRTQVGTAKDDDEHEGL